MRQGNWRPVVLEATFQEDSTKTHGRGARRLLFFEHVFSHGHLQVNDQKISLNIDLTLLLCIDTSITKLMGRFCQRKKWALTTA